MNQGVSGAHPWQARVRLPWMAIKTHAYAKYVLLYIDKDNFLPIGVRVFDDKGLFEQYDYYNLQVNPKFDDAEFTKDYKDYNF